MKHDYPGIYPVGSKWKVLMPVRPAHGKSTQRYQGTFNTVEEALEHWNNCAFYLSTCGCGLRIPFHGDASQYDPRSQSIPAPNEATLDEVTWAKETFPQVEEATVQAAAVPGAMLSGLKLLAARIGNVERVGERLEAIRARVMQEMVSAESLVKDKVAEMREQLFHMQRSLDPEVIAAMKEIEDCDYMLSKGANVEMWQKRKAELLEKFPAAAK